jgi:hypothetical protein
MKSSILWLTSHSWSFLVPFSGSVLRAGSIPHAHMRSRQSGESMALVVRHWLPVTDVRGERGKCHLTGLTSVADIQSLDRRQTTAGAARTNAELRRRPRG